jgi:hypothetical protein
VLGAVIAVVLAVILGSWLTLRHRRAGKVDDVS